MVRLWFFSAVLAGVASSAQAQSSAVVTPTQRPSTERVSPLPGVVLPTGAGQRRAAPLNLPTQFHPGPPKLPPPPSGNVSVGPLDSGRVQPAAGRPAAPPAAPPKP